MPNSDGGDYRRERREFHDEASMGLILETLADLCTAVDQLTAEIGELRRDVARLRNRSDGED